MPTISVIVPVYNAEATIRSCVESVIQQGVSDVEILLVNDGSIDQSAVICDDLAARYPHVTVIHKDNGGVSDARNAAMSAATGDYFFFLDGDDTLAPDTLTTYISAVENGAVDAIIGGLTVCESGKAPRTDGVTEDTEAGDKLWEMIAADSRPFGYAGGKMIRASIVREHSLRFNETMVSQEDLDFFLSVYPFCKRVKLLACYGYRYDYTPSKRHPKTVDFLNNQLKIVKNAPSLTVEARRSVANRAALLVYAGLYDAVRDHTMDDLVSSMASLSGLSELLALTTADGDRGKVIAMYRAGQLSRIRRHFAFRQCVSKLLGRSNG